MQQGSYALCFQNYSPDIRYGGQDYKQEVFFMLAGR